MSGVIIVQPRTRHHEHSGTMSRIAYPEEMDEEVEYAEYFELKS